MGPPVEGGGVEYVYASASDCVLACCVLSHRGVVGSDNGTKEIAEYPTADIDDGCSEPS